MINDTFHFQNNNPFNLANSLRNFPLRQKYLTQLISQIVALNTIYHKFIFHLYSEKNYFLETPLNCVNFIASYFVRHVWSIFYWIPLNFICICCHIFISEYKILNINFSFLYPKYCIIVYSYKSHSKYLKTI